jgi:hypothetical protein
VILANLLEGGKTKYF